VDKKPPIHNEPIDSLINILRCGHNGHWLNCKIKLGSLLTRKRQKVDFAALRIR
jgi:hypothetical protein